MDDILDVFRDDAFGVVTLSGLVSSEPFTPGQVGELGIFEEEGVDTTTVAFDLINGVLTMVAPTPRGAPGETVAKDRGNIRAIAVPHFQRDDALMADEVQGRRRLGTTQREDLQSLITRRSMKHFRDFDVTLEHQRLGALKGIVLDKNGNTMYNLFTEFGVSQESTVFFDLSAGSPTIGVLREKCDIVIETVENNLGADPYDHVHAFCGKSFYRKLFKHPEIVNSYINTVEAAQLRRGLPAKFEFGNIVFERYKTGGAAGFIGDDDVHIFPTGVPDLYKTFFAPADYIETVNTEGLPRYVKQIRMDNDKGIRLEVQTNPLNICRKPKVLMKGNAAAS